MYKIEVTKEDIAKGIPTKENSCAIAKAVRRAVGHRKIYVNYFGDIKIDNNQYKANKNIVKFIRRFDNDKNKCRPFSFTIEKVD